LSRAPIELTDEITGQRFVRAHPRIEAPSRTDDKMAVSDSRATHGQPGRPARAGHRRRLRRRINS
jgi:hypothetical protein